MRDSAKTVAAFCPCPVHLSGVEVKSNRLISWVEGIPPNTEADTWSLVNSLVKVCSGKGEWSRSTNCTLQGEGRTWETEAGSEDWQGSS